ncbi:MAG: hypothetical protein ACOX68_03090 [Candidatus Limivicinus sp.]|jgi:hypothetical protein
MKRLYLPLLISLCLLLSGCSDSELKEKCENFSTETSARENLSFTSKLRAEYDNRTNEFILEYSSDPQGCTVRVVSPEIIRGITARAADGETALEFDGLRLDTGELDDFGLSPVSALPLLEDAVCSSYIDSVWEENGEIVEMLIPSDNLSIELHFDKYTMTPVHAEFISGGRVRVFADIKNWT